MMSLTLALAFAAPDAGALPIDPAVNQALADELRRAMIELRLPDQPAAYFGAVEMFRAERLEVVSRLGARITDERSAPTGLGAELRVGDPTSDNTGFDRWYEPNGFVNEALPLVLTPGSAARSAWRALDASFKSAVANRAAKLATLTGREPSEDPLFDPGVATRHHAAAAPAFDAEQLASLADRVSGRLTPLVGAGCLTDSRAGVAAERGFIHRLESTGASFSQPLSEIVLWVSASATAAEEKTWDREVWVLRTGDPLPDDDAIFARIDAMGARLQRWCAAPRLEDTWVGPVIFEGDAAVELSASLLLYRLSGHPPDASEDDPAPTGDALRLRRRVLPRGTRLVDDPRRWPDLASSYTLDAEGQPPRAVTVVEDGVVRTLLGSRSVSESAPKSTGHARGTTGSQKRALPAQVQISADRPRTARALAKEAAKLATSYDVDHVIVVRRLTDAAFAPPDPLAVLRDAPPPVGGVVEAVRRYPDGRELPIRGLLFDSLALHDLKDGVLGPSSRRTMMRAATAEYQSPIWGWPVTWESPDWLLPEVVIEPAPRGSTTRVTPFPRVADRP